MLKDTLQSDMISAMKAKDEVKVRTIRLIKAAILKYETSGADMIVDDAKVIDLIKKEVKQRNDSITQFEAGGRGDLAAVEKAELEVLKQYLPPEMSVEQVTEEVSAILTSINATTKADMGRAMGAVMASMKGRADGTIVRQVVDSLLQ